MPSGLSIFEEFLVRFNELKTAAKDNPGRIPVFAPESKTLREAIEALESFLLRTDFERRVFHAAHKWVPQAPAGFEATWSEYKSRWAEPSSAVFLGIDPADLPVPEFEGGVPDPESDWFDPRYHDGGQWIEDAMEWLRHFDDSAALHNEPAITADAYDYLTNTIGIDVLGIFRRWRAVPVILMPAHVSNRHGLTEKGSLFDLLDDAVRAFVCGAPAAAIAMCRSALEMVLKDHYGRREWDDAKLGDIIVLASQRFDWVDGGRLKRLNREANTVLHAYSRRRRMSEADENTILEFLKTVKFLIQRAPPTIN